MSKFILTLTTLALSAALAADSYRVNLTSDVTTAGQSIKAGQYKVELQGQKAIFKMGKETVEVPVVVQEGENKYRETQVGTSGSELKEITISGTKIKMVFGMQPVAAPTGGGH